VVDALKLSLLPQPVRLKTAALAARVRPGADETVNDEVRAACPPEEHPSRFQRRVLTRLR
jgi:hypothetical protein